MPKIRTHPVSKLKIGTHSEMDDSPSPREHSPRNQYYKAQDKHVSNFNMP